MEKIMGYRLIVQFHLIYNKLNMKKLLTTVLVLLFFCKVDSQVLIVKNIILSHVIVKTEKLHVENEGEGPSLYFELCIENNTDSVIILHPSKSIFILQFRYKNKNYVKESLSLLLVPFHEKEKICIQPKEKYNVKFGDRIFLGTNILDSKIRSVYDYSRELLQILPSLRVTYKDDLIKMYSNEIQNVTLSDYYEYIPQ